MAYPGVPPPASFFDVFRCGETFWGQPYIGELQATFSQYKRSKNTGDVCKNGRISGETPKFCYFSAKKIAWTKKHKRFKLNSRLYHELEFFSIDSSDLGGFSI